MKNKNLVQFDISFDELPLPRVLYYSPFKYIIKSPYFIWGDDFSQEDQVIDKISWNMRKVTTTFHWHLNPNQTAIMNDFNDYFSEKKLPYTFKLGLWRFDVEAYNSSVCGGGRGAFIKDLENVSIDFDKESGILIFKTTMQRKAASVRKELRHSKSLYPYYFQAECLNKAQLPLLHLSISESIERFK